MLAVSVASIMIGYFATPIQFIKKWTKLDRLKLFNCPICLSFWICIIVLGCSTAFNIWYLIGLGLINTLLTSITQKYFIQII